MTDADSRWQPMDSAPKDGEMLLAYNVAHGDMCVVGWDGCDGWDDVGAANRAPSVSFNSSYFQFWRPLPPPPEAE